MKKLLVAASFVSAIFAVNPAQARHQNAPVLATVPVTIEVTGLKSADGQLLFAIFSDSDTDGFPNDATPVKTLVIKKIMATTMSTTVELPAGTYAISFIADKNNDGKLDTGLFGIPSEGFGFSNNPKISFGAPSFEKCAVDVQTAHQTISMKAVYF